MEHFNPARNTGFWSFFRGIFFNLFKKKARESFRESRQEGKWDSDYLRVDEINFTEMFANRLTNYTLDGFTVNCDDENIQFALDGVMDKAYKWVQMAYGVGRVFLVPYVTGGKIYTDIIPQGRAWVTSLRGDDVLGIGVIADIRTENNRRFYRLASYEYDPDTKTFVVENKATNESGAEIPLAKFKEWETIEPIITFKGIERPLFTFCDCPKDNRTTDMLQGAPITFGCESTIQEIKDTLKQYCEEYELKQSWLGVDRIMLDKNGNPESRLFKTFNGAKAENLFEIFSPDIRDASYRSRLEELYSRLEKQVGTSEGILTRADGGHITATQIRRARYDTTSIVERMRRDIDKSVEHLAYCYEVFYSLLGVRVNKGYELRIVWSDRMLYDETERYRNLMEGRQANAVRDEEIRQFLFPNEKYEDAEKIVEEIKESQPEPEFPDFFGS